MALIKCPECGKEISDLASNCPNCGFPIGFDGGKRTEDNVQYQQNTAPQPNNTQQPNNSYQQNSAYQQANSYQQNNTYQPNMAAQPIRAYIHEPAKNSGLSIAALILSILGITVFIGIILAIVDLFRKDGHKKTLSIVSLCICAFWIILAVSVGGDDSSSEKDTISVESSNVVQESTDNTQEGEPVKKKETTPKKEKPVVSEEYTEVTSTELIDAYNENQVKCKQTYDGKMLKVTGKVQSVGTDIMGTTYVCLGHDTEFTFVGIQCYAKDNETINQIAELREDDLIVIAGKGDCGSLSFSIENAKIVEIIEKANDSYVDSEGEIIDDLTTGQANALKQAKNYLDFSAFSYNGLISQLEYEQYSHEDAVFAADNCGADWNEQAVEKAKSYLEFSSFSRDGLIEQLEYEGFTHEQAIYGAEANGY